MVIAEGRYPISLVVRNCANGETKECFLEINGQPIFSSAGCGAFITNPTPDAALRAALKIARQA
jgi:hypothetical protein